MAGSIERHLQAAAEGGGEEVIQKKGTSALLSEARGKITTLVLKAKHNWMVLGRTLAGEGSDVSRSDYSTSYSEPPVGLCLCAQMAEMIVCPLKCNASAVSPQSASLLVLRHREHGRYSNSAPFRGQQAAFKQKKTLRGSKVKGFFFF